MEHDDSVVAVMRSGSHDKGTDHGSGHVEVERIPSKLVNLTHLGELHVGNSHEHVHSTVVHCLPSVACLYGRGISTDHNGTCEQRDLGTSGDGTDEVVLHGRGGTVSISVGVDSRIMVVLETLSQSKFSSESSVDGLGGGVSSKLDKVSVIVVEVGGGESYPHALLPVVDLNLGDNGVVSSRGSAPQPGPWNLNFAPVHQQVSVPQSNHLVSVNGDFLVVLSSMQNNLKFLAMRLGFSSDLEGSVLNEDVVCL